MNGPLRLETPSNHYAESLCVQASRHFGDSVCYNVVLECDTLYFIIFPKDLGGIGAGHQARDWLLEQGCEDVKIAIVPFSEY